MNRKQREVKRKRANQHRLEAKTAQYKYNQAILNFAMAVGCVLRGMGKAFYTLNEVSK